jgi:hypothetical protein
MFIKLVHFSFFLSPIICNLDDVKSRQDNFSELIHTHIHFHGYASDPGRSSAKILL